MWIWVEGCSLEMKPLVDLTSRALARMIEGKSPEEIRSTFNLPDDLTEEEKLEPLKSGLADARIKLLNKLYAKKRQACHCKLAHPFLFREKGLHMHFVPDALVEIFWIHLRNGSFFTC